MTKKITISVPDELHEKMEKWKDSFNFSRVFQKAITDEILKKELFRDKLENDKTMLEVLENGNFETPEMQYATAKELGFAYARSAPYPEIKDYEQYVKGWEQKDKETIERFHYDLDVWSIFDRLGLLVDEAEAEEWKRKGPSENDLVLTDSFDWGYMTGIMEFIKEECTSVEVGVLAIERDKKLAVAKDENDRWRIFESYMPKFEGLIDRGKKKRTPKKKKK